MRYLVLAVAVILFTCSCSKKITTKKLSDTSWKRVSYTHNGSNVNIWSYPYTSTCDLDNIEKFLSGGIYQIEDIGQVCSPNTSKSGTWEVREGRLIIGGTQWEVKTFNYDELVLETLGDRKSYQRYR